MKSQSEVLSLKSRVSNRQTQAAVLRTRDSLQGLNAMLACRIMSKRIFLLATVATATALALSLRASELEQMKSDLTGQTMGGREKCWKFRSPEHIKELIIQNKTEDSQNRVYIIKLQLEADKACGRYAAEARVEYFIAASGWKIKQVGLLSLAKVQ